MSRHLTDASTPPRLPGQADVPGGALDHTGMYVMHFAFRRDLDDLVAAVVATPADDAATWQALWSYWRFFDGLLHHHHTVENGLYRPALETAVERAGAPDGRTTITTMSDEHAALGKMLDGCRTAFERAVAQPATTTVAALHGHLAALSEVAVEHMAREEAEVLPLTSRVMSPSDHARLERAIGRTYPLRLVPTLVPWAVHGLTPSLERQVLVAARPPERALLRLSRGRFTRRHRGAFHHLSA